MRIFLQLMFAATLAIPASGNATRRSVPVTPIPSKPSLKQLLKPLNIPLQDVRRKYIRGSGKGGQKINKTSNAVQLTHLPTRLTVTVQQERSRTRNERIANDRFTEKLKSFLACGGKLDSPATQQKVKRQNKQKEKKWKKRKRR